MGKTRRKSSVASKTYGYEHEDSRHAKRIKQYERSAKSWKQLDRALKSGRTFEDSISDIQYSNE